MCNVSMIFDSYNPYVPNPNTWHPRPPRTTPPPKPVVWPTVDELRELLDSFHKAVEAAKTFDRVTGQPDCEDPEKAQLIERVEALEHRLMELEAR